MLSKWLWDVTKLEMQLGLTEILTSPGWLLEKRRRVRFDQLPEQLSALVTESSDWGAGFWRPQEEETPLSAWALPPTVNPSRHAYRYGYNTQTTSSRSVLFLSHLQQWHVKGCTLCLSTDDILIKNSYLKLFLNIFFLSFQFIYTTVFTLK